MRAIIKYAPVKNNNFLKNLSLSLVYNINSCNFIPVKKIILSYFVVAVLAFQPFSNLFYLGENVRVVLYMDILDRDEDIFITRDSPQGDHIVFQEESRRDEGSKGSKSSLKNKVKYIAFPSMVFITIFDFVCMLELDYACVINNPFSAEVFHPPQIPL